MIYTTNAIESLNSVLRKAVRGKGHFPNDDAALKLLYLALRNVEKKWQGEMKHWKRINAQLRIFFEDRLPA
jgi:putative transposase